MFLDDANVGRKLLSRMGWEKGRGLGLNEQGNVDFIKVKQNRESRGKNSPQLREVIILYIFSSNDQFFLTISSHRLVTRLLLNFEFNFD